MSKSIVKSSINIKSQLSDRLTELKLSMTAVSKDALLHKQKISVSSLSKYFSNSYANNLTEENIIWLCFRYGIYITLNVGRPYLNEQNKIQFRVVGYNEEQCLLMLAKLFSNGKKQHRRKVVA